MTRRFDQKMMDYAIAKPLNKRTVNNCYKLVYDMCQNYGGYTAIQVMCLRSMLRTMRKRITRQCPELLNHFDYLFKEILEYEL